MRRFPMIFLLLGLLAASGQAFAQLKVGYVNLDRILKEAPAAQRAQKKIDQEFTKRDQELGKMNEQMKKMQENLEKNGMTMSDTDRQKRERELNELNRDFQRKQREFREDLNTRRNDELAGIIEQANKAIFKIAETEKFDLIVQEAVYRSPRIDITDKVIKALEDKPAAK
jgi:outer membrane protein